MEENFNNENETKKPELNNKQEPNVKKKRKKAKIAVITLSTVIVLFLGLQVYASVNGYGNVFFMIKNIFTTGNPAGKEEIFLDKDITLSYKSIELTDSLKIQVNKLEVVDGKTKIYTNIKLSAIEKIPLKYVVSVKDQKDTEITGTVPKENPVQEYQDVLELDYEVKDNDIITIVIKNNNDELIKKLEINLETKEILVSGEKEFEKISEIELKKYLSMFSELNNDTGEADTLLYIAQEIQNNYEDFMTKEDYDYAKNTTTDRIFKNLIIKEFYGDKAEFEKREPQYSYQPEAEVLKGMRGFEYDRDNDAYKPLTVGEEYRHGKCLKIEDISYENEIYTIKYVYLLYTGYDEDDDKLEELPQYETTIKLKRDDRNVYSKYEIVSLEKEKEISNKISTDLEEENNEETNVTNYLTGMTWERYESIDGGLSFEYPADYTVTLSPDRNVVVEMTGDAIGKDVNTGKAVESKLTIRLYANESVGSEIVNKFANGWTGYTTLNGDRWYTNYIDGYNTPGSAGYQKIENYVNYKDLGNGRYIQRMIEFETDNRNNYKITNIINKVIGSTKILIVSTEATTNDATNSNEDFMNTNNWIQYWPDIGMKFKLPNSFKEGEVNEERGLVSVQLTGEIVLPISHPDRITDPTSETVPVIISAYTEFHDDDVYIWDVLENSEERSVKSTDNRQWSDWYPLKDESVAYGSSDGYIRRGYGRVRGDMVEKVIFDLKTNHGMDVPHYTFIRNVLESASSTSR